MASSSDYTIQPTDPTKSPFIIKAYSTNGPATPNNETPLYPSAISANTSLVLLGKGMFDYGQPIQTDLVHILENFANGTAPVKAIQGQLWYDNINTKLSVYTGNSWSSILLSGAFSTPLDVNHQRIINLADPTTSLDGVNLQYLTTNYLPLIGGTLIGDLTIGPSYQIVVPTVPTLPTHATNKLYVDTEISTAFSGGLNLFVSKTGSTGIAGTFHWVSGSLILDDTSLTISRSTLLLTDSNIVVGGLATFNGNVSYNNSIITLTNSNIHGNVSITGNFDITAPTISGAISVGSNRIQNVVDPVYLQDAATKNYVENRISGLSVSGSADGTLLNGVYNKVAGTLTLNSTVGPAVVISNFFTTTDIPVTNTGNEIDIYYTLTTTNNNSWLAKNLRGTVGYPSISLQDTFNVIDNGLSNIYNQNKRYIQSVALPNQLTITLPFYYIVEQHTLHVSVNGIKQYNSVRGYSTITLPVLSKNVDKLLLSTNTSYSFHITVDGGIQQNISFNVATGIPQTIANIPDNQTFNVIGNTVNNMYVGQSIQVTSPAPYNVCNGIYTIHSLTYNGSQTVIGVVESNNVSLVPAGSGFVPSGTIDPIPLYTYIELINQINGLLVGATCTFDHTPALVIYSNTSGSTSSIQLTDGNLFTTLSGTIVNGTPGTDYSYSEVGAAYSLSNTITFITDPGVGKIIEVLDYK